MLNALSRKFIYTHDITLAVQKYNFFITWEVLTKNLGIILVYLYRWRHKPNVKKREVTTFHLNNRLAKYTNLRLCSVVVLSNMTRLQHT